MGKLLIGIVLLGLLAGLVDMSLNEFFAFDACLQTGQSTDACEGR